MAINITIEDADNETPETLKEVANFLIKLAVLNTPVEFNEPEIAAKKSNNFTEEELTEKPEEVFSPQPEPGPTVTVELDSSGLPYDDRIHSESRSVNKNGTWRVRRGANPQQVAYIEAELRARQLETTPVARALEFSTPQRSINANHVSVDDNGIVSIATSFVPPAPPPPAATQSNISFASVMGRIAQAIKAGKLTKEKVIEVLKSVSPVLENPAVLGQKTEFVPAVDAALTQVIGA